MSAPSPRPPPSPALSTHTRTHTHANVLLLDEALSVERRLWSEDGAQPHLWERWCSVSAPLQSHTAHKTSTNHGRIQTSPLRWHFKSSKKERVSDLLPTDLQRWGACAMTRRAGAVRTDEMFIIVSAKWKEILYYLEFFFILQSFNNVKKS